MILRIYLVYLAEMGEPFRTILELTGWYSYDEWCSLWERLLRNTREAAPRPSSSPPAPHVSVRPFGPSPNWKTIFLFDQLELYNILLTDKNGSVFCQIKLLLHISAKVLKLFRQYKGFLFYFHNLAQI